MANQRDFAQLETDRDYIAALDEIDQLSDHDDPAPERVVELTALVIAYEQRVLRTMRRAF